jgi:glycosyltransferase involved in cell wall biosynthesis
MPRVSVTIPTFNCAQYLCRAVDSVLSQTYGDYEIIVVDDGSTDNTQQILRQYGDKVRYAYQPNGGLSSARNLALSLVRGEFIAYIDADDLWYPTRLDKQVAFLDAHAECGLVHSDFAVIDETDAVIHRSLNSETQRYYPEGHCLLDLLRRSHIQVPTVLERRECIAQVGNFDLRLKTAQDYLHWIRIAMAGMAIGYIAEPLAVYRRMSSSLSSSPRRVLEDYVTIFELLASDGSLASRHGQEAADIVWGRLYKARRQLAYIDLIEGSRTDAVRHIVKLIRQWPTRGELYLDLLKTFVRSGLRPKPPGK